MASPLIVEDGTIVAGANSYITLANADAYFDARGNAAWIAEPEKAREEALIKATDYLIQKYRSTWKGIRVDTDQTLDWPRAGVQTEDFFEPDTGPRPALWPGLTFIVGEDEIPVEVQNATAEAAVRSLSGDLLPDTTGDSKIKRLQGGPASIEYFESRAGADEKKFPVIDRMLEPYLDPTMGQRRVFRA